LNGILILKNPKILKFKSLHGFFKVMDDKIIDKLRHKSNRTKTKNILILSFLDNMLSKEDNQHDNLINHTFILESLINFIKELYNTLSHSYIINSILF